MNKLTATMRSKTDKLSTIRNNGMVPAVVYGARVENQQISVSSIDFQKILKIAGESSTIVLELKTDSAIKKIDVLIHEVQVDPIKGTPIHIDFLAIDMNKVVEVTVPIEFTEIALAEKNGLGVLVKVMHEIEVEALPKNLPHNINVDLSVLINLGDQILVKDVKIPKEIKITTDQNEVIALIAPIKEEKEEESVVDLSAIEVEKKGKKEESETEDSKPTE